MYHKKVARLRSGQINLLCPATYVGLDAIADLGQASSIKSSCTLQVAAGV